MRQSLKCPKCASGQILSYLDGLVVETTRLLRARRKRKRLESLDISPDEPSKELESLEDRHSYRVYLCDVCGYSERYLNVPDIVKEDEVKERLELRLESPPSGGSYR